MALLRKLSLVAAVVFLRDGQVRVQLGAALGIIFGSLVWQMLAKPYRDPAMDALERLSLYALALVLYMCLFISDDAVPRTAREALSVLLVLFNLAVLAYFVLAFGRALLGHLRAKYDADGARSGGGGWRGFWGVEGR